MNIFAKLFSSRKWVTAVATIVADLLVFWKLPLELATQIAALITITAGIYIAGQAIVDATGNHEEPL